MKATTKTPNVVKSSMMTMNPKLDAKYEGKVLFSEKLAQAKDFLGKKGLPKGWGEFKEKK